MITEIKIGPEMVLQLEEPLAGEGITIAGTLAQMPSIDNISRKIYFKVDNGPKIRGYPGRENYPPDLENIEKPDNHVAWRLEQHERRLWQSGGQPCVGVEHEDYRYEIELTPEQGKAISKYFL